MRLMLSLLATLALATGCQKAAASQPEDPLEAHLWKHRVILITATSMASKPLTTQREWLGISDRDAQKALGERHLVIYTLIEDRGCRRHTFDKDGSSRHTELGDDVCNALVKRARGRLEATETPDFHLLLIGKDGGDKLESKEPVPKDRLFDTIDAMPMRLREMREHRAQGT